MSDWFQTHCSNLHGQYDANAQACCLLSKKGVCDYKFAHPPNWVKNAEENIIKYRRFFYVIMGGIVGALLAGYILTMYWGWMNWIVFFSLGIILLEFGKVTSRAFWFTIIVAVALILFSWFPLMITRTFINPDYPWSPYYDIFSHFMVGWASYHVGSALFKRSHPVLAFLVVLLVETCYEILEATNFGHAVGLEWSADNMWEDFSRNIMGGLTGMLLEYFTDRKYGRYIAPRIKMVTVKTQPNKKTTIKTNRPILHSLK